MSYSTPAQVRSNGLVARRFSDATTFPDSLLQAAIDKADARMDAYIGVRNSLPLVSVPQLFVDISVTGASWFLLENDGVAPTDEGVQLLFDAYERDFGEKGTLWRYSQGQLNPFGVVDSTPNVEDNRSRFVNRPQMPSARQFDSNGNEYF